MGRQALGMPLGWVLLGAFGVLILTFMTAASILAKVFPGWGTEGVLPGPKGEVSATLIPQGGHLAALEAQLQDQTERNEKLLRMLRATESERDLAKAEVKRISLEKDDLRNEVNRVEAEIHALHEKYDPPPVAPEALDRELVIAIKTYGFPAYEALNAILERLWEPVRNLEGIGKFLPSAWSESTGQYIRDQVTKLSDRLARGDNGEPFVALWQDFHRAYGVELAFWAGRVHYFHPADEVTKSMLAEWLPFHDQYYSRVRELGNAPDGQAIKGCFDRFDSQCRTHRDRFFEAAKPSVTST